MSAGYLWRSASWCGNKRKRSCSVCWHIRHQPSLSIHGFIILFFGNLLFCFI
jgi:hypothetical protein